MTETIVRQFEAFTRNGGGSGPKWLQALRHQGLERFRAVGFPSPRDEEWRFTPVGPIARTEFALAPRAPEELQRRQLEAFLFGRSDWARLVFVDGRYRAELSVVPSAAGWRLRPLSAALAEENEEVGRLVATGVSVDATPFAALNAAFVGDGAIFEVDPDVELQDPVHLLFVNTAAGAGVATHPRNLVVVGANARAQVVESYVTLAPGATYLTNVATAVMVGAGAWLEHARIQRESEAAYHIAFSQVEQDRRSHYRSFSLAMGGAIARHNLHAQLNAPNVESLLYGLYVGRGDQLIDNHTAIFHDHPDCQSWEVYKGILDDRAHGVFNGKIFVKPEAQKTDAKQTNRALLLSETASIDTKPQLEIFADDVKCTHGAAVGKIDEQAFYYAQSRGIPRNVARRLLTYAFAAEVLDEVAAEPVRTALESVVRERLAAVV